jgi:hypothetical protein
MVDGAVEIIMGRERRRRWSVEDKLKVVAETLEPGASVNQIAARHGDRPEIRGIMTIEIGSVRYVPGWGLADGMDVVFGWDAD